ncbi:hypothetical protein Tco_0366690 [Tanacetum coccineum]
MAPNRSKSRYAIKECSTCGSWYTKECCSIGNLNDQIIVPVPDSSQHCAVCGTPVDGPYCHGCTLIRMKFEKDLFAYCVDNGVFQNFQDTSESSNDNTNVVNAPREPSVVDQDPGENFPQNPPQIDHNCCYECGDSLNGIFCQQCICEFCGKDFENLSKILILGKWKFEKGESYEEEKYAAACRYMLSITCDDEDDYIPLGDIIAQYSASITHGLNDRVLCENIVPIPSEFEGISDDTSDVPTCDNNCVNVESDLLESLINRDTSIVYSSKIDPILEEFADELAHIAPIPPGIVEADFDPNDDISNYDVDFWIEADVPSFSDNSILRGIESDRDSGEDTTSIDDLPLDDSMIFSEYETFTFDDDARDGGRIKL